MAKPPHIIVTGTSSGIGLATVKSLIKSCKVLALSRNISTLKDVKNPNLHCLSVDLTQEADLQKAVAFIKKHEWSLDGLINNAGKLCNKPFEATTTKDFMDIYQVNVFAVAALTRLLIPFLKKGSHVVNISSIGGVQGSMKFAGLSAYSSSKGALITLTELLSEAYKTKEISFNALALGAVATPMLQKAFPEYQAPMSAEKMGAYIKDFVLKGHQYYNGKILPIATTTP